MKRMINENVTLNVVEHIITRNYWEYYVTDNRYSADIVQALVLGYEDELGDISLSEIGPYVINRVKLEPDSEVLAAPGWRWENE